MTDPKHDDPKHDPKHDPKQAHDHGAPKGDAPQEGKPAATTTQVDPKDLPQSINEPGGKIGTEEPKAPPAPPPAPPNQQPQRDHAADHDNKAKK